MKINQEIEQEERVHQEKIQREQHEEQERRVREERERIEKEQFARQAEKIKQDMFFLLYFCLTILKKTVSEDLSSNVIIKNSPT